MLGILFSLLLSVDLERVITPPEVKQETRAEEDPSIKDKVWNRWTSKNFTVCSINDSQAQYLNKNLESVKTWVYTRWGLPDQDFSAECRLLCVADKAFYNKLFQLDETRIEVRKDNGKITMSVIFLLLDDKPSKTIPLPLTEVCLAEYEQKNGVKVGMWARRGMALLNGSIPTIRQEIGDLYEPLKKDKPLCFSKALFQMTEEQYAKETVENKRLYDRCAAAFCLMLRKEFGQEKFLKLFGNANPGESIISVYGFKTLDEFDATFKTYLTDLTTDLSGTAGRKTPDSYLQITPKK
jgi:hypothetical protein